MVDVTQKKAAITVDASVGGGATWLGISGRIGVEEAKELQRQFETLFRAGRPWIIVSMVDVDFICSAGMGTLLSGVGEARKAGGEVIFIDISAKAKTVFEFLDVWDYIATADDRKSALAMVAAAKARAGRRPRKSGTARGVEADVKRGISLSKEGKIKDAVAYFNAVLKVERDNITALTWKANALERLGQLGEACRLFQRVCELGPANPKVFAYARERLRLLKGRLGTLDKGAAAFGKVARAAEKLALEPESRAGFTSGGRTARGEPFLECLGTWDTFALVGGGNTGRALVQGNGYFLWLGGRGIFLDPGRNSLARFKAAGRRLADIDAVILTSSAWEHVAEFEPLIRTVRTAGREGNRLELLAAPSVIRMNYSWLSHAKDVISNIRTLRVGESYAVGEIALDVRRGPADEDARGESSVGLLLATAATTFAYVADAAADDIDVVAAQYRSARGHVLLVHVGGVFAEDDPRKQAFAEHLGVENVTRLIAEVRPAVALLGGIANVTDPVVLAHLIAKAARVPCLPVDVGLKVELNTGGVILGESTVPAGDVHVALADDGSLLYGRAP